MNPTHVTVSAAGGTAFGSALAAVIAHKYNISVDLASSWVVVLTGVVAFIGGLVGWFFSWKWPKIPPPPPLPLTAVQDVHTEVPAVQPVIPVATTVAPVEVH